MPKACLITLGCPKNTVEGENIAGMLEAAGWSMTTRLDGVDCAIVHTCSFIKDSRNESEDAIRSMAALKKKGLIGKLYVTGCLAQEEKKKLLRNFTAVDGIIGTGELQKLPELIGGCNPSINFIPGGLLETNSTRLLSSAAPSAYLRIAEGCNHKCSFCIIPSLRGKYKSREMNSIVKEAKGLAACGIKELVLIAQDTTFYGKDLYGNFKLPLLLKKLARVKGIEWIRLLYAYPDTLTDEMLDVIREEKKICKYIDIPLQHVSDNVLRAMKRKPGVRKLVENIKARVPGVSIRTTFITGFPGETKEDFNELLEFVKEGHFEHMGAFEYSPHPGTLSASYPAQVNERLKIERKNALMLAQQKVVNIKNKGRVGKILDVLIDGFAENAVIARSRFQAPEIDGIVYVKGKTGNKVIGKAKITGFKNYDLTGQLIKR